MDEWMNEWMDECMNAWMDTDLGGCEDDTRNDIDVPIVDLQFKIATTSIIIVFYFFILLLLL